MCDCRLPDLLSGINIDALLRLRLLRFFFVVCDAGDMVLFLSLQHIESVFSACVLAH